MNNILKPSRANTRREKIAVGVSNLIIKTFCTKQYESCLRVSIALGVQELDKMLEEEEKEEYEQDIHE